MKLFKIGIGFLLCGTLLSCSEKGKGNANSRIEPEKVDEIEQFLEEFKACKEAGSHEGYCALEDVEWDPRQNFKGDPNFRTVMVLDSGFFNSLFTGRYEERTKAILKISEDFQYIDMEPRTYSVTKGYLHFFRDLTGSAEDFLLLKDVAKYKDYSELFEDDEENIEKASDVFDGRPHGAGVAALIYELAPKSNVVIAKMANSEIKPILCQKDYVRLSQVNIQLADSLIAKIKDLRVDLINLSQGVSRDQLKNIFLNVCQVTPTEEDLKQAEDSFMPFYRKLANIPHVLLIQAAGSFASDDIAIPLLAPIDCASNKDMPNRIRIDYSYLKSDLQLAEEGTPWGLLSNIRPSSFYGHTCVDAYINIVKEGKYYTRIATAWDWEKMATFLYTSSFASPLFTSLLIDWDAEGLINLDDINAVQEKISENGEPKVFDPTRYEFLKYF